MFFIRFAVNIYLIMENKQINLSNLSTLRGKYLLREIREGFDVFMKGGIRVYKQKSEGFEYTDFSMKCEILVAPENGKYKKGQNVFVHHQVSDDKWSNEFSNDEILATREENILFAGESPEDCDEKDVVVFKYRKKVEKVENGIVSQVGFYNDSEGIVVSGGLKRGDVITYRINKELEIFWEEEQYLFIDLVNITSLNGKPYGFWYEVDDFENDYFDTGIIQLKGQTGLSKKHNIELRGRQKIVKLKNEKLPYNNKMVLCQERWKDNYLNASTEYYLSQYNDFKGSLGVLFLLE